MNVTLAKQVLKQVRKHPERHDQQDFIAIPTGVRATFFREDGEENHSVTIPVADFRKTACGTSACIAGWAAAITAPEGSSLDPIWSQLILPDGRKKDLEMYARGQLGLDAGQAEALFYCFDNDTAIKRLEYLTEHESADLEELEKQLPEPGEQ